MGTFTCVLQGYFLEAWVPLLPPQALGANHLLEVSALFLVSLPDEVVNKEGVFVLPLELLLAEAADRVKCLLLDPLQNLVLRLFVLTHRFKDLDRVRTPSRLELFERAWSELPLLDGRDNLVVEEGHLPFVLVEALGEVLKVAISQVGNILHG